VDTTRQIRYATAGADLDACRELFSEYAASLEISLDFQHFADELARLPGDYVPPRGALLLARENGAAAACVALRPLGGGEVELKRLYVRPAYRGSGWGTEMLEAAITRARSGGAHVLWLDTLPTMLRAMALYRARGFEETGAYHRETVPGMRFFRLDLLEPR
jgi:ribosomal protein S18 acetylase RimI-like enzyme